MLRQSVFCREKPDLGGFQGFFEEYVPVFLVCVETYLHRGVHLSFGIRGAPTSVICARIILYSMFIFSILGTVIIRSIYYHITTTWKEGDGYERYS
jgi:hypothetical protein